MNRKNMKQGTNHVDFHHPNGILWGNIVKYGSNTSTYTTLRNNTEKYYDVEVLEAKND